MEMMEIAGSLAREIPVLLGLLVFLFMYNRKVDERLKLMTELFERRFARQEEIFKDSLDRIVDKLANKIETIQIAVCEMKHDDAKRAK